MCYKKLRQFGLVGSGVALLMVIVLTTGCSIQPQSTGTVSGVNFSRVGAGLKGVSQSASDWGDFDGDGDIDLFITGQDRLGFPAAAVYENKGSGNFSVISVPQRPTDTMNSSSEWGDFDGDGDPDLVVTGNRGSVNTKTSTVYENDVSAGNGFPIFVQGTHSPQGNRISSGLTGVEEGSSNWGDFDGDGDLDLVITGLKYGTNQPPFSRIYENAVAAGNAFQPVNAGLVNVRDGSSSDWGDYDQDGDPDLVITGEDSGGNKVARIYRNDGGGTFTNIQAGLTAVNNSASQWGDLNGDGRPDLLVTGTDASGAPNTTLYKNNGSGNFTPFGAGLPDVTSGSIDLGDFDKDGYLDVVITGVSSGYNKYLAEVYENTGAGSFNQLGLGLKGVIFGSSDWGDFDGDRDLDLVVTGKDSNGMKTARIYENKPVAPQPGKKPKPPRSACVSFENITPGTVFRNGDQFSSGGFKLEVGPYQPSGGGSVATGTVTIDAGLFSPSFSGPGNEAQIGNSTLQLNFQSKQPGLTFAYQGGGGVNLQVNGDTRVVQQLKSLHGKTVGGNPVKVRTISTGPPEGFVTIQGPVRKFSVGGAELGIDDICPGCITFEDLSTGKQFAQGSSVTTGGFTFKLQPFTLANGNQFTNGDLTIRNDKLKSFHLGNKAFTGNVLAALQLPSSVQTISFLYENFGGNLNLRVNADLRYNLSDFSSLNGQTVGGARVRVNSLRTSSGGHAAGFVTIKGNINDFAVGGQELFFDDICTHGRSGVDEE